MTDENLIEFVYEMAVRSLEEKDFKLQNDTWWEKISSLPLDQQITYCVMITDQQILRGGFNAWFINTYAQFANYAIQGLNEIGANSYHKIVNEAFLAVMENFDTYTNYRLALRKGSLDDLYDEKSQLSIFLDECDDQYYELEENLIALLADYLRRNSENE